MTTKYRSDLTRRTIMQGDECLRGYYRGSANTTIVESVKDAASIFAHRAAQRIYGKRGYCHHVREDLRTENGNWFLYEAFVGVPAYGGGTNGKNIRFTVTLED